MNEERLAALMKVECHRIRMLTILDATIIVRTEEGSECFNFDSPEAAEAAFSAWLDAQHSRSEKGAPGVKKLYQTSANSPFSSKNRLKPLFTRSSLRKSLISLHIPPLPA
jgi:hypothetical protein